MPIAQRIAPLPRTLVLLTLVLLAGACEPSAPPSAVITPEELAERIAAGRAPVILDVRSEEEFAAGHLPGARNVPHDALAERLGELGWARDAEIVVHCHSGQRASVAEEILREAGYSRVRDLDGHWQGWQEAGLPTG